MFLTLDKENNPMINQKSASIDHNAAQEHLDKVWNRLHSLLTTTRAAVPGYMELCHQLRELPSDQRPQFLHDHFGAAALDKCQYLLSEIEMLEKRLAGQ
jgi:hypothetical protein